MVHLRRVDWTRTAAPQEMHTSRSNGKTQSGLWTGPTCLLDLNRAIFPSCHLENVSEKYTIYTLNILVEGFFASLDWGWGCCWGFSVGLIWLVFEFCFVFTLNSNISTITCSISKLFFPHASDLPSHAAWQPVRKESGSYMRYKPPTLNCYVWHKYFPRLLSRNCSVKLSHTHKKEN